MKGSTIHLLLKDRAHPGVTWFLSLHSRLDQLETDGCDIMTIQPHLLEFTIVRGLSDGIPQGDLSVAKQTNLVCFDVFRIKANKEGSITPLSFHRQSV